MPKYQVREGAESYGHTVGVLLLDCSEPFIPGDVANATTYPYPVLFRTVPGLTIEAALSGDPELEEAVVEGALELERHGVRGITSNCGFLLHYQEAVAAAVGVPVLLSSLLQLPLIAASLGPEQAIGVVTANSRRLGNDLFRRSGVKAETVLHVAGLEEAPEFKRSMLDQCGMLDSDRLREETVEVARGLADRHPEIGAILFECAVLPPYAHAVQAATRLPVFDFVTMIDYLHAGSHRQSYHGAY